MSSSDIYQEVETRILPKKPSFTYSLCDNSIRDEYITYITYHKPLYMLILSNVFTTLICILAIIASISYAKGEETYGKMIFLSYLSVAFSCVTPICGWILFYQQIHGTKHNIWTKWIHKHYEILQFIHLNSMVMTYALRLIQRSYSGQCQNINRPLLDTWNCNPYAAIDGLPLDTTAILMLTPLVFASTFREMNLSHYLTAWSITSASLIVSALAIGSVKLISIIVPYICFSLGIVLDNAKKNSLLFYMTKHIHDNMGEGLTAASLEEGKSNGNNDDMVKAMRNMVGNVAHDLKTPLSSFMTGIDIIGHIISECETNAQNGVLQVSQIIESLNSAKSCLENIKNTNAFMLMTINRCLDYTKASSGMKLIPKNSSVGLLEAITVPIKCMQNLQTKIEINLLPISPEICTHIITDQQWLLENLLCLLSNAVKYSDKGTVNVSVSLKNKEFEEKYFMESNNRRSFLDYVSSVSSQHSGSTKYNNNGAMVYPEGLFHQPSLLQDIDEENQEVNPPTLQKAKSMRALGLQEKSLLASFFKLIRSSLFEYFLHFEIEDEGVGFDPSRLEEVFHPFDHQGDRIVGGTGLGLYSLAKRIEALNGLYGVKARLDGKQGSIFWFSRPYQPDQAASELDVVSFTNTPRNMHFTKRPKIVPRLLLEQIVEAAETRANTKAISDGNNHSNLNTANKSVAASLSKPNTGHMKPKNVILNILVVDDSPTITKMTKMMLRRLGHKVSIAENGEIALKMIKDHWHIEDTTIPVNVAYDVIVMDLQMPIMDGLQATKELRKQEKSYGNYDQDFHHLVIGVSANSDPETTQDAYSAGIDYFIAKPFTVETFYHAVNKFYRYNGKL